MGLSPRKLVLLLILISSAACKKEVQKKAECDLPHEEQTVVSESGEIAENKSCIIPEKAYEANLAISYTLREFDEEQESKMDKALSRLEIIINSEEFKSRVLNHEFEGEKSFKRNNDLSNEEIYEFLLTGAEQLNEIVDQEIDLDLTLYHKDNGVVGYTYPSGDRIWVNDKFFSKYTLAQVAKNAVHEWTHKMGFKHSAKKNKTRKYTVPYAIGSIMQELIEKMTPVEETRVAQR